jgi:transcriptional regulator with XRE-family HTH domain
MANQKKPDPIDVHVGSRVKLHRKMLGITQEMLGDSLGITFQQVQKYEKGANRISASRLQQIAAILSVPVSFFFEGAPGTPSDAADAIQPADSVVDFISSPEGIQLNKALAGIKDNNLRRVVVNLVKAMAGEEGSA